MLHQTRIVDTFPSIQIPNASKNVPIEVSLISQLGHRAGNHIFSHTAARQKSHTNFIDELNEPSAKLGGVNIDANDTTSLYSFIVGPKGHPFHRHAGHRIFTAISGSGGAQLRFSTATSEEIEENPNNFIKHLHFINIPPDCLFTVRFGGETWHQFWPLSKNSLHPVFVALSCHTDELGGNLSEELKRKIIANKADIPSLTELLPDSVSKIIKSSDFNENTVPTTTLSLDAPAGTAQRKACDIFRGNLGLIRSIWAKWYGTRGFISKSNIDQNVTELKTPPKDSLLCKHLNEEHLDHDDTFTLNIINFDFKSLKASQILELLLEGFLMNSPQGVSRLMMIRNVLVKPLGLRTSPLGCPVSSLLSDNTENLFANQYPVIDQEIDKKDTHAQVILGADDKHLKFRSCVSVKVTEKNNITITLGTRVHCKNPFGKLYMHAINYIHRHYITPTMLRRATDYVIAQLN